MASEQAGFNHSAQGCDEGAGRMYLCHVPFFLLGKNKLTPR